MVFVSGTSLGCISDSLGAFRLKVPYLPCILIADHVAYQAFVNPINSDEYVVIQLKASLYSINEVSVSGKNKRKRNLRFFYSHFLQENQSRIKILNDSVLFFKRDKMSFTARCSEPLIIENKDLGYKISVIIQEFKVAAYDGPGGQAITPEFCTRR